MAEAQHSFDLVIIGGGPGGYSAAIRAAQLGMRPAVVEMEQNLGGICLNWGCIPTKALLRQAEVYRLLQSAGGLGFTTGEIGYDWAQVIKHSRQAADRLARGVAYLMKKNQVQVFRGRGRITPSRQVEVRGADGGVAALLDARHLAVATGGRPQSIPGVAFDGKQIISSREAMQLEPQPKSLAIIGAGAIGVEFASFYSAFGTRVTLLELLPQVLPREDEEVAGILARNLVQQGISVATGVQVTAVETGGGQAVVRYQGKDGSASVAADQVLVAVGVTGNVEELGLEALGVRVAKGAIEVDERLETSVKGISAFGDVAGPPQLAHKAIAEAVAAVESMAGRPRPGLNRRDIPRCVYCQPQVASLGLSEQEARQAGHEVKVGRFPFTASGKAQATGQTEGLVKLVFEAKYGELLGASLVGSEATELIAELGLARHLEATYEELLRTVHAHPTLSEAVAEAAGQAFGEALNL